MRSFPQHTTNHHGITAYYRGKYSLKPAVILYNIETLYTHINIHIHLKWTIFKLSHYNHYNNHYINIQGNP